MNTNTPINITYRDLCALQSEMTYNGNNLQLTDQTTTYYMGIGFCSVKHGLTYGLPVDVMQMLLPAAILKEQILKINPKGTPRLIILLADSMAVGTPKANCNEKITVEEVGRMTEIYRKSLIPLLELLKLREYTEIMQSSVVEATESYNEIRRNLKQQSLLGEIKENDRTHYKYILQQTTITEYMRTKENAFLKLGWITKLSNKNLQKNLTYKELKDWDELKFDMIHRSVLSYIDSNASLQILYAHAGLKYLQIDPQHIAEACPYTAYPQDRRNIIQLIEVRNVNSHDITRKVAIHWSSMVKTCEKIKSLKLISNILPQDLTINDQVLSVMKALNYWSNLAISQEGSRNKNSEGEDQ